jgi:CTP synthase
MLSDAYISVVESLRHAGARLDAAVNIKWVLSEDVEKHGPEEYLSDVDGIIVPGGFGDRGIEGKITASNYARTHKIPYLGLCLGMQIAVIEFARNVANMPGAHSTEFDPHTKYPVIDLMPDQHDVVMKGGTMRLGKYPCHLSKDSKASVLYGSELISERHRHRYEVNNSLREQLSQAGLMFSGLSPDGRLVEMIELPDHPFYIASQFHPELKSRPDNAHPLFVGLVQAVIELHDKKGGAVAAPAEGSSKSVSVKRHSPAHQRT